MVRRIILLFLFSLSFIFPGEVNAQSYRIQEFASDITVQKDTSLLVKETINVNFLSPRHGIFRNIPVVYTANGRTIRTRLEVLSVTDKTGSSYIYEVDRRRRDVEIKIGDPGETVTGEKTYIISYKIDSVLQRFDEHEELYWNVAGGDWDTAINTATATVHSSHADIQKADCFAGTFGSEEKLCRAQFDGGEALFASTAPLGRGRDFTIVVALDKENELVFPGILKRSFSALIDNWGYLFSIIPFGAIFYFWYKRGRDKKYAGDNIYYEPDDAQVIDKPLFQREHLPSVYSPIQGLTPAQVGTVLDEAVDFEDIIAEIIELARLGYIKIDKFEKKKLIGKSTDYGLEKLNKKESELNDYQAYLLEKLFSSKAVKNTAKDAKKTIKKDEKKLEKVVKLAENGDYVLLSAHKNTFYKHLDDIKDMLYKNLEENGLFIENPNKTRKKWIAAFIAAEIAIAGILFLFLNATGNFWPLIVNAGLGIPGFFFAYSMPRKTAYGYSLFRQAQGLSFYIEKGKWRHEIAEKHLFIEEILPLAVSLGVVDKLTKDMEELKIKPPEYTTGFAAGSFSSDMRNFETSASSGLVSRPGSKGGSWSGGSGFSGGSSGGGFGGGGGGSW